MSLFVWMVLGAAVGWLTSQFMKDRAYGQTAEILLGIAAAVLGGIVTGFALRLNTVSGFNVETLVGAMLTALVVIATSRIYKYGRART
jgi:uncharacterized membrane protein YeaQ/YmgE (transglycosylase-associated protein family)